MRGCMRTNKTKLTHLNYGRTWARKYSTNFIILETISQDPEERQKKYVVSFLLKYIDAKS